MKSEAKCNTDQLHVQSPTTKCQLRKMVIQEEGLVYHVSSIFASYIISAEEGWGGVALRGSLVGGGGGDPAVAVSTQKKTAGGGGGGNVKSVRRLESGMAALQL